MGEFGTVKAIGGGNWDIYRILAKQATIAAVAGFALGGFMTPIVAAGFLVAYYLLMVEIGNLGDLAMERGNLPRFLLSA